MSRVRWGNVAQLAVLVAAVALIAFGTPDGCGSEPEVIPLDALPGEPVEAALEPIPPPPPSRMRPAPTRNPARPSRQPQRRSDRPVVTAQRLLTPVPAPARSRPRVPEAAREFSFDR